MPMWMILGIPDTSASHGMAIDWFHDYAMMTMVLVFFVILVIFIELMKNKMININLIHGNMIELIWTILPMLILFNLAIPSMQILYFLDEVYSISMTIKIIGHQWYWSYEYSDYGDLQFDSYMLTDLDKSSFRLLDVDNYMVVPVWEFVRLLISSDDVIHSWAVPSIGVKVDAIPGRINQVMIVLKRIGLFFGQCSEICGINHSFMPIVLESTSLKNFMEWVK